VLVPRRQCGWFAIAGLVATQCLFAGMAQASEPRGNKAVTEKKSAPVEKKLVTAPLPPRRPASLPAVPAAESKPDETNTAAPSEPSAKQPSACLATFAARGGIALPTPSDIGSGACAVDDPVVFNEVAMPDGSKVKFDSAITVRCSFALDVLTWVRDDLPAIAAADKSKPARILGVGGHACRPRNGVAGARLSEHASGNALDLGGFTWQDGRTVALTGTAPATRTLREAVRKSACERFATVLGPGADASHKDHLHLDMRSRPRGYKICQWTVE